MSQGGSIGNSSSSSSGSLVLIQTQRPSNVASVNFTSGITSSYDCYMLVISGLQIDADFSSRIRLRMSVDGGSTYDSGSNYNYSNWYYGSDASQDWNRSSSDTSIFLSQQAPFSTVSTDNGGCVIYFHNLSSSSQYKAIHGHGTIMQGAIAFETRFAAGYKVITAVNAFQIYSSLGNIMAGSFSLYGIKP